MPNGAQRVSAVQILGRDQLNPVILLSTRLRGHISKSMLWLDTSLRVPQTA
jgi:hypothetical protein